jgi:hypothetical protein
MTGSVLPTTVTRAGASTVACTSSTPGISCRRAAIDSGARRALANTSAKWPEA